MDLARLFDRKLLSIAAAHRKSLTNAHNNSEMLRGRRRRARLTGHHPHPWRRLVYNFSANSTAFLGHMEIHTYELELELTTWRVPTCSGPLYLAASVLPTPLFACKHMCLGRILSSVLLCFANITANAAKKNSKKRPMKFKTFAKKQAGMAFILAVRRLKNSAT